MTERKRLTRVNPHPARRARRMVGVLSGATYVGTTFGIGAAASSSTTDTAAGEPTLESIAPSVSAPLPFSLSGSAEPATTISLSQPSLAELEELAGQPTIPITITEPSSTILPSSTVPITPAPTDAPQSSAPRKATTTLADPVATTSPVAEPGSSSGESTEPPSSSAPTSEGTQPATTPVPVTSAPTTTAAPPATTPETAPTIPPSTAPPPPIDSGSS